jgi:hypothetical protein
MARPSLCAALGSAILIEQPHSAKGRRWFFLRGIGGFGAEYGVTLDKRTVARRCERKAGTGSLRQINGLWHWLPNH